MASAVLGVCVYLALLLYRLMIFHEHLSFHVDDDVRLSGEQRTTEEVRSSMTEGKRREKMVGGGFEHCVAGWIDFWSDRFHDTNVKSLWIGTTVTF
jgi:hypothetical protein